MEKIQGFTNYMKQLQFKKTVFGGYSKKDVAQKLEVMMDLFMKCVEAYEEEETKLIEDYEKRMALQDEKIGELNMQVAEKEKLKAAYKESCASILAEYSDSIRSLSAEFTHVMENVTRNVEKLQRGLEESSILEKVEVLEDDLFSEKIEVSEENFISEKEGVPEENFISEKEEVSEDDSVLEKIEVSNEE